MSHNSKFSLFENANLPPGRKKYQEIGFTAEGLARITKAALAEFVAHEADFQKAGKANSRNKLRDQYRQDAEDALRILAVVTPKPDPLENDVTVIRRILDEKFVN